MLKSRLVQILLVILNALLLGFIVDRITGSPYWGIAGILITSILGFSLLPISGPIERRLHLDASMAKTMKTIFLVFVFFIECLVAAWYIAA